MFHHHNHDEPGSKDDHDKLLSEGAKAKGMVAFKETSDSDHSLCRLRIEVRFPDREVAQFTTDVAPLYQPSPGTPEADRLTELRTAQQLQHASRVPKIQLPLWEGSMLPLRYDPAHRKRIIIDEPALHRKALDDYIEREKNPKPPKTALSSAGPPWVVPTTCPTCGAPVDQAKASIDPDPFCGFCEHPIPVSPLARP